MNVFSKNENNKNEFKKLNYEYDFVLFFRMKIYFPQY